MDRERLRNARLPGGSAMTNPLEIIPQRTTSAPVQVLHTLFQRPLDPNIRPTALDLSLIPTILREKDQWILWKYQTTENGKPTKVPCQPRNSRWHAKVNDPSTWSSFERAVQAMGNGSGADGTGFVFTKENGYVVVDLDHVIIDGTLPVWIQRLLAEIRTYAEASPSGTGIHLIGSGTLPGPGSKRGDRLEMYTDLRYLTFTGNRLLSHPETVESVNVDWLHRLMLARAFDTKNPKFEKLLNGDHSEYPSQSEADLAFCSHLAGLGLVAEDLDRMVRLSGLYRDKWNEQHGAQTYGAMTIAKVLASPPSNMVASIGDANPDAERWQSQLLRNAKGKVQPLLANVLLTLRNDSRFRGMVAFDEFIQRLVIQQPTPWHSKAGAFWTDYDDSQLAATLQRLCGLLCNTHIAAEGIQTLGQECGFHPVRDYLKGLIWDGQPRLDSWLATYLGAEQSDYSAAVGRCWLIAGVARILRPGSKVDTALLLVGPQGGLKSQALQILASEAWFSDHLSDLRNKDSRVELLGRWVIEISEMDRVRRADQAVVKAFLSTRVDVYRPPYGRRTDSFPRSCIFAATANDPSTLSDESGNRRWWPINTGRIDLPALARDRNQLWAEANHCFSSGAKWWLDSAELERAAAQQADEHYQPGPWDERILEWSAQPDTRFKRVDDHVIGEILPNDSRPYEVTLNDCLVHAIGKTLDKFTFADQMQVQRALIHAGYIKQPQERIKRTIRRVRFYKLPLYKRPTPEALVAIAKESL
jgi:predicted P-loop ATPase